LKFKTTVSVLQEVNHITDPRLIYPGQILRIPLPFSPAGDTSGFPVLRRNSSGPFVLLVQSQLSKLGYYKGAMDGVLGATTEGSIAQFQLSRSLPATGTVDVPTWKQLLDDGEAEENAPGFHARMAMSGLFMLLTTDKPVYSSGEPILFTLMKVNFSAAPITLNYNTSQRYEFKLTYPSGRPLWRWSDGKSFTQVLGSVVLTPGQTIRYTASYTLPPGQPGGIYHVYGWNTAKQTDHLKLHLNIKTTSG